MKRIELAWLDKTAMPSLFQLQSKARPLKKTVEAASGIASVSRDVLRLAREVDLNERRKVGSADSSSSITSVSERTKRERDSNSRFTSGNPVAKTQQAQIFKPGASRPAPIKVPVISPELTKIGENLTAFTTTKAPSDISIGQMVSDRSIAYVLSGGLGCDKHSA